MTFVALATCSNIPEPDADEPLLVAALERAGVAARVLAWDDASVDWSAPAEVVIRSTWNYHLHADAFLAWAREQERAPRGAGRLQNPASIVAWNLHKRYLRALEAEGFPVVPTLWLDRGSKHAFDAVFAARGWDDIVAKPAVSAGSYRTARLSGPPFVAEALDALVSTTDAMVQPYVKSVDGYGERSLIWIDGELTHAVRKTPRFAGESERVSEAMPIADEERRLALAVMSRVAAIGPPLYGRVDMVRDARGEPMLSEVELIEPSLFLAQSSAALDRFAGAIARRFRARSDG